MDCAYRASISWHGYSIITGIELARTWKVINSIIQIAWADLTLIMIMIAGYSDDYQSYFEQFYQVVQQLDRFIMYDYYFYYYQITQVLMRMKRMSPQKLLMEQRFLPLLCISLNSSRDGDVGGDDDETKEQITTPPHVSEQMQLHVQKQYVWCVSDLPPSDASILIIRYEHYHCCCGYATMMILRQQKYYCLLTWQYFFFDTFTQIKTKSIASKLLIPAPSPLDQLFARRRALVSS